MSRSRQIVLVLVAVTSIGAPAKANLIVNGSFELPGGLGEPVLEPGSAFLEGWVVTRGSIDYIGGTWPGLDGARSIDLDGTPGFGGVSQSFTTVPGESYRVSFLMAGNPYRYHDDEPRLKRMRVSAAGAHGDFEFLTDDLDNGWEAHEWEFIALTLLTTLEFYSLDTLEAGYSGYFGPALDKVVVARVPEASSTCMIALGLVILSAARRRQPVRASRFPPSVR